jgi:hypothetical protein
MFQYRINASRRPLSGTGKLTLGLAILIAAGFLPLYSQSHPPPPSPPPIQPPKPPVFVDSKAPDYGPPPERTPTFQDMQYRRYVESRLKSMVSDADKLLKLAKELNSPPNSPIGGTSREEVHTVAEIEKLAHNVKWKMQLVVDQNR